MNERDRTATPRRSPHFTTPSEIHDKIERLWKHGRLLAVQSSADTPLFPLSLRLTRPDARALAERFEEVRRWIRALENESKMTRGFGYEIIWEEINHRQLGRNRLPVSVMVPTPQDALAMIGKRRQAERFSELATASIGAFPALATWLAKRPLIALEHADDWDRVLLVLGWLQSHPRPGLYLRQLEIPGVDTKFIEARKGLLAELLDIVLPPDALEPSATGARQFELRYGFLSKPPLVRFRMLDPTQRLSSLSDLATPALQFAELELPVRRVFITENDVNGLAFPPMPESLVVFGLGYGLERLSEIGWLRDKCVHYWGDIDTHGFAMLDRLREGLPATRSLLMDRETLMAHQTLWTREDSPHDGKLTCLTQPERSLYDELKGNLLGAGVRLEQERIAFAWVKQALSMLE